MFRKSIIKILATVLTVLFLFSFSLVALATEDGYPLGINLAVSSSVKNNGVYAGVTFDVPVVLNFDELFLENVGGGIIALQFTLQFDSTKLQLVDYVSHEPIEFDETGTAINGLPFIFGAIANESRFTVKRSNIGTIIVSYFSSTDNADDITISDTLVTFSLKARDDIEINGSTNTTLGISGSYAAGVKSGANIKIESDTIPFNIKAPFKLGVLGDTIIGDAASVVGRHYIDQSSAEPITMQIQRDGIDAEQPRSISASKISINELLTFDEEVYSAGAYSITFRYRDMTQQVFIEVKPAVVIPEPEPVLTPTPSPSPGETDEPEESEKPTATPSPTPTVEPTNTPAPTATPTAKPTSKPSTGVSRPAATSTPAPSAGNNDEEVTPTPTPSTTDKEDDGEDGSDSVQHPSDIDGHWAGNSVRYVYDNSLMNGYADGTFGPDNKITRAEFTTVMARYLGLESAPDKADHFSDVKEHWAKGYIGALVEKGIVNGVSDELFAPDSTVTREQIAVILSRTLALEPVIPTEKYADDAQISSWAYDGVYSIFTAGIMKGDTSGNFSPLAGATRAEVATILYRLHSKK